jgi:hypothetical protein
MLPTLTSRTIALTAAFCCAACGAGAPSGTPVGDEALIANAMSAAPSHIAQNAAVTMRTPEGQMRMLRKGTNGYTCMPDNPRNPGNMPMCIDAPGLAWARALRDRREPPSGGAVAVAYMLQGSAFPSYDDPFAKQPPAGGKWETTGPVLMIMNVRGMLSGYSAEHRDPREPFIMFQGTPYEHLMIPLATPM